MNYSFHDFELQGDEVNSLLKLILQGRMVHALLISGESGTGKRTLASVTANALLCTSDREKPCGKCKDCQLTLSDEHPDLIRIEKGHPLSEGTKKNRSSIPVEDIRELIRICNHYPFRNGNRVVLIPCAEDLTPQAQNALLKILEEPPPNTFFILTSSHPDQLLITIRSRCRQIKMKPWPEEYIRGLLLGKCVPQNQAERSASASSGSIGKALSLASDNDYWTFCAQVHQAFFCNTARSDVLKQSSIWKEQKIDGDRLLDCLDDSIRRLMNIRFGLRKPTDEPLFSAEWLRFAMAAPYDHYARLVQYVCEARRQLKFNMNLQAVVEQLLFRFLGERDLWVM